MEQYILELFKNHGKNVYNVKSKLIDIIQPLFVECNYTDTTGLNDCSFLSAVILKYKPKNIMEIGTWVGTTSYAMALTSPDVMIYTCDNNDRFVNLGIEQNNRIKTHPKTYSTEFLKNMLKQNVKFDMIFNDASISDEDCEMICDLMSNDFIFVTHDYYNSNGLYEKGYFAMESMKKILSSKNIQFVEYTPDTKWYSQDRINGCCGILICYK